MKLESKQWTLALACAALAICLSSVAGAATVTVGAPVIDRAHVDGSGPEITIIDVLRAAPAGGEVTQWVLWAGQATAAKLQVFRPAESGYMLVGENAVNIAQAGYNVISIQAGQRIPIEAGDLLGFRYQGPSAIEFDPTGSHAFTWPEGAATNVAIGGVIPYSWFTDSLQTYGPRTYSLAANIETGSELPEPATLTVIGAGILALVRRRRR